MAQFRWIITSFFLILMLQLTAAASFTVRAGDDVTLPCEHVIDGQRTCDSTTWVFSQLENTPIVVLIGHGRIAENAKSDRLSVTENCSLVMKKVTEEDAGRYTCRHIRKSGQQQGEDALVELSIVTMTEHNNADNVTLHCFVSTYERCQHTVKWLFQSKDVDKDNQDLRTSQSPCYTSVTFPTSHFSYTSRYQLFRCEVTEGDKVQEFPFSPQSSGEDTTTTKPTTTAIITTTESTAKPTTESRKASTNDASPNVQAGTGWPALDYIMLALRVAEVLLMTVITVLLLRARGRIHDDNTELKRTGVN
ncbi:uncharacterized protein LOC116706129 isoform X2 [Etheostoma spectabile]|uniref:uncharacterized protein LOC116706129 isoform X2 n=1 Tax=Etheostoma spectabile TaxID=54343 RepID=UPI0013AFCF89|nr:uncharacterized protein LOC116706129 isoform X2 [Etheostoma spectabile]